MKAKPHRVDLFAGSGALRAELRLHDWSSTAAGHPGTWPIPLRNAVSLMLDSQFPMFVVWGSEMTFLYNGPYTTLLGSKHPAAMGAPIRSVWPELWNDIQPLLEKALTGEPTYGEDVPRTIWRDGRAQESWFTLSYSPIRDDDGTVVGAFCVVTETTARVLLERRQAFQLQLADQLRGLSSPEHITAAASELVGRYLQAGRVGYSEVTSAGDMYSVDQDWTSGTLLSLSGRAFSLQRFGKPIVDALTSGRTVVMSDTTTDALTASSSQAQTDIGIRSNISVPLIKQDRLAAVFYLHDSRPRVWTNDEVALIEDVAERIWNAVERARVEQERAMVEKRLQEGMSAARMMVWEWELASGKAKFSENASVIFGRSITKMESIWEWAYPEDLLRLRTAHKRALGEKGGYREVIRFIRPDNNETVWHDIRGEVRCDASGAPVAMRGVTVDVSDRMRAQTELTCVNQALAGQVEQLEKAKARQTFQLELADLLRGLSDPSEIFIKTSELLGRYLNVPRVLYGDYDPQNRLVAYQSNYTDGTVSELNGPYPAASFGANNFASLEDGTIWICDDLAHDPRTAGPDTWPTFEAFNIYSAVVVPLSRNGALIACLFINDSKPRKWTDDDVRLIVDVSERIWSTVERVRAEEALRQADVRKDQFLAMLAHELRNPLAPISAAAELLKLAQIDPDRIRSTSDIIARQVNHMTGLVDDLLDVSRVTRGVVVLDKEEVDIKRVVSDAVEQVRPLIETRCHHFAVHMAPDSVYVLGDYKRLVQVLANLINNAAKYTPEGGNILLRTEATEEHVVLRVSDNGIGIPQELLPNVFELFSQAARSSDRSQGGLGLGLALVKSLVELHGGSVAADSKGHNAGSEFTLRLPRIVKKNDEQFFQEGGDTITPTSSKPLRLMVVDDNVDAAQMLAMFLEITGHQVVVEHDPHRTLERSQHETFDAYLLDIGLPGMDGNELVRRLRAMPTAKMALMVAITGYGQQFDQESAIESGFDHYFVKPADPMELVALLADVRKP